MSIISFIDEYLDSHRVDSPIRYSVDSKFIYAYAPFMCMYPSQYELVCDKIASTNSIMRGFQHAAYLIRKITSGISYESAKKTIKEFIIAADKNFTGDDKNIAIRDMLIGFANNYLKHIRAEQRSNGHLESFITCAAPVVPYENTIVKEELHGKNVFAKEILAISNEASNLEEVLFGLMLNNIEDIMTSHLEGTVNLKDEKTCQTNAMLLDRFVVGLNSLKVGARLYYYFAAVNFFNIPKEVYEKHLHFLESASDFSKTQSYNAFESMIDEMADYTNISISAESWDDPTMDEKADDAVNHILRTQTEYINTASTDPKYDFGKLNDFINVKRYMKFEEFPNRFFLSSLEKTRCVNVNKMGPDRNYYEMDNDTVACPFLDLRTYNIRVVILHANSNDIEIIDDIRSIY